MDIDLERIPKRVWIGAGVGLALFGGVVAAGAASLGVAKTQTADLAPAGATLLRIEFAPPAPLEMPAPAPAEQRLEVLADPPADLSNLDPDARSAQGCLAMLESERRYKRMLDAELRSLSTAAVPEPAAYSPPRAPALAYDRPLERTAPEVSADHLAASGDTSAAPAETE